MAKYSEEIQKQCVEKVKEGKSLAEITRELGPNPKAIQRYCVKAGVAIPKAPKKEKVAKAAKAATPATPVAK